MLASNISAEIRAVKFPKFGWRKGTKGGAGALQVLKNVCWNARSAPLLLREGPELCVTKLRRKPVRVALCRRNPKWVPARELNVPCRGRGRRRREPFAICGSQHMRPWRCLFPARESRGHEPDRGRSHNPLSRLYVSGD